MPAESTIEIGLLNYPHAQQAAILGLTDLLMVAGRIAAGLSQLDPSPIRISHWQCADASQTPQRCFDSQAQTSGTLSALIVPPTLAEPIGCAAALPWLAWLRDCHAQGALLGSVCAGAFLLAETGLLTGRSATTHWAYEAQFQQRFPQIRLDTDRLIIDDGDIITAGGVMAWTDLGLRLVDRFLGPTVMIATAQRLVMDPPGREQRYYSVFSPRLTHGDAAILKVQHWLQATEAKDMALATLAAHAQLEERTFLRRFHKATGMTSTEYCQRLRVGKARQLLQFSAIPIERVAWEVGYSDTSAFRKVFMRVVGLPPSEYRNRFQPAHSQAA